VVSVVVTLVDVVMERMDGITLLLAENLVRNSAPAAAGPRSS
jgi:hypothetical protein